MGLGYIGLPTAALIASRGIQVQGIDVNQSVVDTINSGKIHIVEPALDGLVKHVVVEALFEAHGLTGASGGFLLVPLGSPSATGAIHGGKSTRI